MKREKKTGYPNDESLISFVRYFDEKYREDIAFQVLDECRKIKNISYHMLCENVLSVASCLMATEPVSIGLIGYNSYEWVVFFLAGLCAGKEVLLFNPFQIAEELDTLIEREKISTIYVDRKRKYYCSKLNRNDRNIEIMNIMDSDKKEKIPDLENEHNGKIVIFSSGTCGTSKAVVIETVIVMRFLSNLSKNKLLNIVCKYVRKNKQHVFIGVPFFHCYGMNALLGAILYGEMIVMTDDYIGMKYLLGRLTPEFYIMTPVMLDSFKKMNLLKNVWGIILGGAPLNEKQKEYIGKKFYCAIEGYGLSETFGVAFIRFCGKIKTGYYPLSGVQYKIAGDGELLIRAPWIFSKYRNEFTDNNADSFWKTGDLASKRYGAVQIVGRKKDVIVLNNGEKIFAPDIDEKISHMDNVKEGAVVCTDNSLVAVLVVDKCDIDIDSAAMLREINLQNDFFIRISKIILREKALPRTITGKVKRYELEKEYEIED